MDWDLEHHSSGSEEISDFSNQHPLFACTMCQLLPPEPFSCNSCGQIICKDCFKGKLKAKKDSTCPHCKAPIVQIIPNAFAKRLIGELVVKCPNLCGEEYAVSDSKKHQKTCTMRPITCVECKKSMLITKFEDHIFSTHADKAL